jgi:hypothetical protein
MEPFEDSAKLLPVRLNACEFKQFFLTVHVPKTAGRRIQGNCDRIIKRQKTRETFPYRLRVLPFELPAPKPYFDLKHEFIASIMGGTSLSGMKEMSTVTRNLQTEIHPRIPDKPEETTVYSIRAWIRMKRNFALLKELASRSNPS